MSLSASRLVALAAAALLSGCTYTVVARPDAYPVPPAERPALTPGVSVSLANYYTEPDMAQLEQGAQCDMRQFTETAIEVLRRELAAKGLVVADGAAKSMRLRIANPTVRRGSFGATGTLRLEAVLGDDRKVTVYGETKSVRDHATIFNSAIPRAVGDLLGEAAVVEYLNSGS